MLEGQPLLSDDSKAETTTNLERYSAYSTLNTPHTHNHLSPQVTPAEPLVDYTLPANLCISDVRKGFTPYLFIRCPLHTLCIYILLGSFKDYLLALQKLPVTVKYLCSSRSNMTMQF